jgi:hypothetical protein
VTNWGLGVEPGLALVLAVVVVVPPGRGRRGVHDAPPRVVGTPAVHRARELGGDSQRFGSPGAAPTDHTQAERDRYPDCGR